MHHSIRPLFTITLLISLVGGLMIAGGGGLTGTQTGLLLACSICLLAGLSRLRWFTPAPARIARHHRRRP